MIDRHATQSGRSASHAGPTSAALGRSPEASGLIVALTQVSYGASLPLDVSLGDHVENRRLVLFTIGVGVLGLLPTQKDCWREAKTT
jgi:hypothetical protein